VSPRHRKAFALGLVWLALISAAWLASGSVGLERNPDSIRDFIRELGAVGPVVFIALIGFRLFLGVPSQLMLVVAGLCFGIAAGTLYGAMGLTLSAGITFGLARWTGREAVERNLPSRARPLLEMASSRMGGALLVVGTGYPIGPMTIYHAAAGLTGMAIRSFLAAVCVGATVRAFILTSFGSSLMEGSWLRILAAGALLTALIAAPLFFTRSRRWLLGTPERRGA
jgi:uncharacterized membrane protein YdjX (TVP38/TMEM64 family)